jgi:hypothetical protein
MSDDFAAPDVYENLPADAEQAFLTLEDKFRAELGSVFS